MVIVVIIIKKKKTFGKLIIEFLQGFILIPVEICYSIDEVVFSLSSHMFYAV